MRVRATAVAVLTAAALTGCSSSDGTPTADPSEAVAAAWSPCDGVDAAAVSGYAGEEMAENTGTADTPRCTFTPVKKGGPVFDLNYLWFDGGLTEALDSIGKTPGVATDIDVPGADAARIVVHARRPAIFVSGFVQTTGLVQSVNAVQLRPYDERAVVAATKKLLAALVDGAPQQ